MRQGWRWFGPDDPVTLDDVRQAGATDVVSSLHDVPSGEAWTTRAVSAHRALIEDTPPGRSALRWSVIESIPIPDAVKRDGIAAADAVDAWIASLEAVAAATADGGGPRVVCYNFMPVLDWTRTDLDWRLPSGATALLLSMTRLAAFDIHILRRPGAEADYAPAVRDAARAAVAAMDEAAAGALTATIVAGLPGGTTESLDLEGFRAALDRYRDIGRARVQANLADFTARVAPKAQALGLKLALHPDDPPFDIFGLPRVVSTAADYAALFETVPVPANGMCFCAGSLSASPANDLQAMAARFAGRIHFLHLRSTRRLPDGSFYESEHLDGGFDMVALLRTLLNARAEGRLAHDIVFRPDHGHRMLDDLSSGKRTNPGYSAIGRLKGLAELRGALRGLGLPPEA